MYAIYIQYYLSICLLLVICLLPFSAIHSKVTEILLLYYTIRIYLYLITSGILTHSLPSEKKITPTPDIRTGVIIIYSEKYILEADHLTVAVIVPAVIGSAAAEIS